MRDLSSSMEQFQTSRGLWQGGWNYLSCDGDTCGGTVDLEFPAPPDYFNISGAIDSFRIDALWEGTAGDTYSTYNSFTVAPRP